MREWTETHIRELIKRELGKVGGNGFSRIDLDITGFSYNIDGDTEHFTGYFQIIPTSKNIIHVVLEIASMIPSSDNSLPLGLVWLPSEGFAFGAEVNFNTLLTIPDVISVPKEQSNYFTFRDGQLRTQSFYGSNVSYGVLYNMTGEPLEAGTLSYDYNILTHEVTNLVIPV